ncbi:hypothetical protein FSP39_002890 [Pinctada imbricata]|uniref:Uncharacterized protein n=1 Tax=Pinctada imbricata TaxID=66713 RepID=A0AA89C6G9_PINIB|nr:hypothetical protein FSP39_002890 [Pinctada imbricata]
MSAAIATSVISIWRRVGSHTTVANNPVARLSYYLHCVDSTLVLERHIPNIDTLQNYREYYELTKEEIDDVVRLCNDYRPEYMEGRCFFLLPEACEDAGNEFYDCETITATVGQMQVALPNAAASVQIAGVEIDVAHRMTYRDWWMKDNFVDPMGKLQPWLTAYQSNSERPIWSCRVKVRPKSPFPESDDPFSENVAANLLISYFFPLWIFGWMFMMMIFWFHRYQTWNQKPRETGEIEEFEDRNRTRYY